MTADSPPITKKRSVLKRGIMSLSHVVSCLIPMIGGLLLISVLVLLLRSIDSETYDIHGQTISRTLALYTPYKLVLIPMLVSSFLIFVVTMSRNIQVRVYFSRRKQYTNTISYINKFATIMNIFAYVAFIVVALNKDDPSFYGSNVERTAHLYAAALYFIFSNIYVVLHTSLLLLQRKEEGTSDDDDDDEEAQQGGGANETENTGRMPQQFPLLLKINFALYTIVIVFSSVWFLMHMHDSDVAIFEWVAIFFNALYIMLFSILFHIDPIEDELSEFFLQFGFLTYFQTDTICKSSLDGEIGGIDKNHNRAMTAPTIKYTNSDSEFDYQRAGA